MKDNNTVPIIAAIITAIASIAVAMINSNAMKEVLNTEIIATQTAEARLTSTVSSTPSSYLPTVLPSQTNSPTPIVTMESSIATPGLLPTPQPMPANNSETVAQPTPTVHASESLTVRFRELEMIVFFFVIAGMFLFLTIKLFGSATSLVASMLVSLICVSPLMLLWLRFSFLIPSLPWLTVLFSAYLPMSVLCLLLTFNSTVSDKTLIIFISLFLMAPFITSFGFTFWSLGVAALNAIIAISAPAVLGIVAIFSFR